MSGIAHGRSREACSAAACWLPTCFTRSRSKECLLFLCFEYVSAVVELSAFAYLLLKDKCFLVLSLTWELPETKAFPKTEDAVMQDRSSVLFSAFKKLGLSVVNYVFLARLTNHSDLKIDENSDSLGLFIPLALLSVWACVSHFFLGNVFICCKIWFYENVIIFQINSILFLYSASSSFIFRNILVI